MCQKAKLISCCCRVSDRINSRFRTRPGSEQLEFLVEIAHPYSSHRRRVRIGDFSLPDALAVSRLLCSTVFAYSPAFASHYALFAKHLDALQSVGAQARTLSDVEELFSDLRAKSTKLKPCLSCSRLQVQVRCSWVLCAAAFECQWLARLTMEELISDS